MRKKVGQFYLNEDRFLAFENLLLAYAGHLPLTDRLLMELLATWQVFTIETKSKTQIGAIVVKQGEGHIGILKEHRAKWHMSQTIPALCDALNINRTAVAHSTPRVTKFLERYGWQYAGSTPHGINYIRN